MKRKILPILLAFPVLLSGCAGIKKAFHPVDWFKTEVLKIEDTTIDAQDCAELPSKFVNFSADIHYWIDGFNTSFVKESETHFIYCQTTNKNFLRTISQQAYIPRREVVNKLDLIERFSSEYLNVTPTDENIGMFIKMEYQDSTYSESDLNYIIDYREYEQKEIYYETGIPSFFKKNESDEAEQLALPAIFNSIKLVCAYCYPMMKYDKNGKFYLIDSDLINAVLETTIDMSTVLKVYFIDNLPVRAECTFYGELYNENFTIDFYDIGTTVIE